MRKIVAVVLLGGLFVLLGATSARADLIGDSVTVQYLFPDTSTVCGALGTATVTTSGATFSGACTSPLTLTVFGSQLVLALSCVNCSEGIVPAAFNGFKITDNNPSTVITGFTVDPSTTMPGFDSSRVSFDSSDIFLNLQNSGITSLQKAVVDLQVSSISAPEPSSLLLLATGLLGLAGMTYRKKLLA